MMLLHRLRPGLTALTLIAALGLPTASLRAQLPELIVRVGDTTAASGEQGVRLPVYMSNLNDTIDGFDLWVQMSRPDIAEFATFTAVDIDTIYWCCITWDGPDCADSQVCDAGSNWDWITIDTNIRVAGIIDTVGTLMSGWELVSARSLSGLGTDMKVTAIADLAFDPTETPGIPPQQDGVLFYFVLNAFEVPDTMTDRTVELIAQQNVGNFCFSDPSGNCIGFGLREVVDSSCFVCLNWAGDICLEWQRTSWSPGGQDCDSIGVEIDSVPYLDTNQVVVYNGSLSILYGAYGDINNDGSAMDISDLVYLVNYMFAGGPAPDPIWSADCDYDGDIDISDLVCWVTWMFPPQ